MAPTTHSTTVAKHASYMHIACNNVHYHYFPIFLSTEHLQRYLHSNSPTSKASMLFLSFMPRILTQQWHSLPISPTSTTISFLQCLATSKIWFELIYDPFHIMLLSKDLKFFDCLGPSHISYVSPQFRNCGPPLPKNRYETKLPTNAIITYAPRI